MTSIQIVFESIFQWLDLFWIPLVLVLTAPKHWLKAIAFILCCVIGLRLQLELLDALGLPGGLFHMIDSSPYIRGLIVYGLVTALYLWLLRGSSRVDPFVVLAASLTIFAGAFILSSIILLL